MHVANAAIARALVCCVALLIAGFAVGGCGGSRSAIDDTTTTSTTNDCREVGGCFTGTTPPHTLGANVTGDGGEDCSEAGGCVTYAYAYVTQSGEVFLCSDLRLIVIRPEIAVQNAPVLTATILRTLPTLTAVPVGTAAQTSTAETTPRTQLVTRPSCPAAAKSIPAVGVSPGALGELVHSEDGETAWTPTKVRLKGRIVEGKFVVEP